ncbi:MAG: hypothetical protein AABW46_02005 [Nanoarchaeota archaeon]
MHKIILPGLGKHSPLDSLKNKNYTFLDYNRTQSLEKSINQIEGFISNIKDIELIGHSLGATLALVVGTNNDEVRKVIAIAPICLKDTYSLSFDNKGFLNFHGKKVHKNHFESLTMKNIKKLIKKDCLEKKIEIIVPLQDKYLDEEKIKFFKGLCSNIKIKKIKGKHNPRNTDLKKIINSL